MSLTCYCGYGDDFDWHFSPEPDGYTTLHSTLRKRCCSCHELIAIGAIIVQFTRFRYPDNDLEERIHGGDDAEIPLATWRMCERCGDLFWSLDELGFCMNIEEDQRDRVKEYAAVYGSNNG